MKGLKTFINLPRSQILHSHLPWSTHMHAPVRTDFLQLISTMVPTSCGLPPLICLLPLGDPNPTHLYKPHLPEASRPHSSAVISLHFGPSQSLESSLCMLPLAPALSGINLCICLKSPTRLGQYLTHTCIYTDKQTVGTQQIFDV